MNFFSLNTNTDEKEVNHIAARQCQVIVRFLIKHTDPPPKKSLGGKRIEREQMVSHINPHIPLFLFQDADGN